MYRGYNDDDNEDFYSSGNNNGNNEHVFLDPMEMIYLRSMPSLIRMNYMNIIRILNSDNEEVEPMKKKILKSMGIEPEEFKPSMSRKKLRELEKYYRFTFFDPSTGILN
jgi:hypothetical protein